MRFEFYLLTETDEGTPGLEIITAAGIDASPENAKSRVEGIFNQIVTQNPDLTSIVVIAPGMGSNAGGSIVACELIDATPVHILKSQGRPLRQLVWLTHPSTKLT